MTTSTSTARTRRRSAKAPEDTAPAVAAVGTRDVARIRRGAAKPSGGPGASTPPSDATAGRAKRQTATPLVEAGPAVSAADAPVADRTERSVVDQFLVSVPSGGSTRARLVDRIERGVAPPQTDTGPSTAATIALAAPAISATSSTGATAGRRLRRLRGGVATAPPEAAFVIGVAETRLFDCPRCARPLATGTSRCPGCGVRLIKGVALGRVGVIVASGIAVGVILVGGLTAAAFAVGGQAPAAVVVNEPSTASIAATAAPTGSDGSATVGPPSGALAALSGTAVVNGRIAVDAGTLTGTLARSGATTVEIARALRSLAADAAFGMDLAGRLRLWPAAAPTVAQLDAFYHAIAGTARLALRAPLSDDRAYRAGAAEMMTVLRSLGAVDAASRSLAVSVGLELPPVNLSGTSAAP